MDKADFFELIAQGNAKSVLVALEEDADLWNATSDDGGSILDIALQAGFTLLAKKLITCEQGDICQLENDPLHTAIRLGNIDIAEMLLTQGASPNHRAENRTSVLIVCLENEYFDLASLLIEKDGEVDICNEHGWTPLMWASVKGRKKAVEFLLDNGANIHACNNDGWNAVTGAYFKKRKDIIDLLIAKGAIFGAKYAEAALLSAYDNGYVDVVEHLINGLEVGVNVSDDNGLSLLAKAVTKADWPTVKLLVEKGADVNARDEDGVPLIVLLAQNGHDELLTLFLEHSADIHLASNGGQTAIYRTAVNNQLDTVRFLIDNGADINAQTNTGWTPLMAAASKGYSAMAELLVELGANVELLTEKGSTAKKIALSHAPRAERGKHLLDTAYETIAETLTLPGHFIDG